MSRDLLELYVLAPWRAVAAIAVVALLGVPGVVGAAALVAHRRASR